MARIQFALRMLKNRYNREAGLCPYCGSRFHRFLQKKWLVIQARKCEYCGLIYRWPTDAPGDSEAFYASSYEGQQATDLPDHRELESMRQSGFGGTPQDKKNRVDFLGKMGITGGSLLDFGCSWGYSTYQYMLAGMSATGFELDRGRALYGRDNLGIEIVSDWDRLSQKGRFDVILADHSLEHVPRPGLVLDRFAGLVTPNSRLVLFVPNGACRAARSQGVKWGPFIGESHTVAFTGEWFQKNLPRHGFKPRFYSSDGNPLTGDDYLCDQGEIACVATTGR